MKSATTNVKPRGADTASQARARLLTRLVVTRIAGEKSRGRLTVGALVIHCALGAGGTRRRKREGDGATPLGRHQLLGGYVRSDRLSRPRSTIGLRTIHSKDGWCDDPRAAAYNRPVTLPCRVGHEDLCRSDGLYDVIIVLDYNIWPRTRGGGSAIFFHLATDELAPTAGCVAIRLSDMRRLLPRLSQNATMIIR